MPSKHQKIITALNKFMWLKRRVAEQHSPAAKHYWKKGDRKLLEEALSTYEDAKAVLLDMHRNIIYDDAELFYSDACPFCLLYMLLDCRNCPYEREKGRCGSPSSVWIKIRLEVPFSVRHSTELTVELWHKSGCYELARKLAEEEGKCEGK